MKQIWHMAFIDIRLMVKDKVYLFWTLLFPLVFIFIFGNLYKNDNGSRLQAELLVLNQDSGQWGDYLIEKLEAPGILLKRVEKEPEEYTRLLIIPGDFSRKIQEGQAQELIFKKVDSANQNAAKQAEIKVLQGIVRLITEMVLHPDTGTFFKEKKPFRDILTIKSTFPENTVTKRPAGFDHVIPGTMVQFIMMMVLIYGGVTVMIDRKRGTLQRMLFSSASILKLWTAKFLGRLIMGLIQALILIIAGKILFDLNLGNNLLSLLNITVFSIVVAALSILVGSVIKKEDLIVGISVMLANIFAALGGCWWPIEIVPAYVKTIGMISPAYWAMDAFHQIIFFNKGIMDIWINLVVMLIFALFFTILAVRFFKIRE